MIRFVLVMLFIFVVLPALWFAVVFSTIIAHAIERMLP